MITDALAMQHLVTGTHCLSISEKVRQWRHFKKGFKISLFSSPLLAVK